MQTVDSNKSPEETPEVASLSFEEALERLEGIVDRLEQGDLELEDALGAFEKGVALTRRIDVLVKEGEKWLTRPFDEGEDPDAGNGAENSD